MEEGENRGRRNRSAGKGKNGQANTHSSKPPPSLFSPSLLDLLFLFLPPSPLLGSSRVRAPTVLLYSRAAKGGRAPKSFHPVPSSSFSFLPSVCV